LRSQLGGIRSAQAKLASLRMILLSPKARDVAVKGSMPLLEDEFWIDRWINHRLLVVTVHKAVHMRTQRKRLQLRDAVCICSLEERFQVEVHLVASERVAQADRERAHAQEARREAEHDNDRERPGRDLYGRIRDEEAVDRHDHVEQVEVGEGDL